MTGGASIEERPNKSVPNPGTLDRYLPPQCITKGITVTNDMCKVLVPD